MTSILKQLDLNPQIESFFLKRSVLGAIFSIIGTILSILLGISVVYSGESSSIVTIDKQIMKQDRIDMSIEFPSIPCEFIKTSIRNYYDEDITDKATIRLSSTLQNGVYKSHSYSNRLLPLYSESIKEINQWSLSKSSSCPPINGMNPPSDRICKTCADYITYYTDAGFKTSKLISQLEICQNYTVFSQLPVSCSLSITSTLPNIKSMITVDTSRFTEIVSSDDFEDDKLIKILSIPPKIKSFSVNGHDVAMHLPHSNNSFSIYDFDITLVPRDYTSNRNYNVVTRSIQRPLSYLDRNESPGLVFVFDYSGIMKNTTIPVLQLFLSIIVTVGGVISIMGYVYSIVSSILKKSKSVNVDYQIHSE